VFASVNLLILSQLLVKTVHHKIACCRDRPASAVSMCSIASPATAASSKKATSTVAQRFFDDRDERIHLLVIDQQIEIGCAAIGRISRQPVRFDAAVPLCPRDQSARRLDFCEMKRDNDTYRRTLSKTTVKSKVSSKGGST